MINRIAFTVGLVLSIFFSFSTYNYAHTLHSTLVSIPLSVPELPAIHRLPHSYTAADLKCLSENMYYEARNQSPQGQVMVGIVTIERTRMQGYPNTICGVVHQHAQFSWTLTPHKINVKNKIEREAWKLDQLLAQNLLINLNSIDDVYNNVAYYHKSTIHPKWADYMHHEFVVDDHVFYSKGKYETSRLALL